jgi:hypothetical protein
MTPEEFEKIKAAEKEHLRKVRKLKTAVKQLERQKKISGALTDLTTSMKEKFDVHDEMMDRVAIDSALNEARLEIALETSEEADRNAQLANDEADLAKERARQALEEIRSSEDSELSDLTSDSAHSSRETESSGRKAGSSGRDRPRQTERGDDLPEKTIGRMKP